MKVQLIEQVSIRLFRNGWVTIWIKTPELHVYVTCYFHEHIFKESYVDTTYYLHEENYNERYVNTTNQFH